MFNTTFAVKTMGDYIVITRIVVFKISEQCVSD
jgi:hypothetical protein